MICFRDREDAGRNLATALLPCAAERPTVLALPPGGVPVGYEVARALHAPLDVWVARRICVPRQRELTLGAVAEGEYVHRSPKAMRTAGISEEDLIAAIQSERRNLEKRVRRLRGSGPLPHLRNRTVIVIDDGIGPGSIVRTAIASIRAQRPAKLVLGVPVASPNTVFALSPEVDVLVALLTPLRLYAVGDRYEDFSRVSDDEIAHLLRDARRARQGQEHAVA